MTIIHFNEEVQSRENEIHGAYKVRTKLTTAVYFSGKTIQKLGAEVYLIIDFFNYN